VSADLSRPNVNNAAANFLTMVEQEWKSYQSHITQKWQPGTVKMAVGFTQCDYHPQITMTGVM